MTNVTPPSLPAVYVDAFHIDMNGATATITVGQVRDGVVAWHSATVMPLATALELADSIVTLHRKIKEPMPRSPAQALAQSRGNGKGSRRN